MALLHLRVVAPADLSAEVLLILRGQPGATNLVHLPGVAMEPAGDLIQADVARECAGELAGGLRELGVDQRGSTNSPITIVGAMVVGPEFGPLAAIAVGLRIRRADTVRQGIVALLVGFTVAIAVTAAVAVLWRAAGLVNATSLASSTGTEFIYQPGWFSLITAVVAGAAGILALTSAKSAALVGVFISVTTIPAAGNGALALVFGRFHEAGGSALQLLINLTGIIAAAYLVLLARGHPRVPGQQPDRNI